MNREIVWTAQFKKDYRLAEKRKLPIDLLDDCIRVLAKGEALPPKHRDHDLSGSLAGHRECHVQGDWLLIYRIGFAPFYRRGLPAAGSTSAGCIFLADNKG